MMRPDDPRIPAPSWRALALAPLALCFACAPTQNPADPDEAPDVNYNATFSASSEPFFGGGEGAFNVFDNRVGGGNNKWCCAGPPVNVSAHLDAGAHVLTHFTITSGNDVQNRDPRNWKIQGSNDGVTWTGKNWN